MLEPRPARDGREDQKGLGARAEWVQHVKGRVAEVRQRARRLAPEERKRVKGVSDDLGDGPGEDHACVQGARLRLSGLVGLV